MKKKLDPKVEQELTDLMIMSAGAAATLASAIKEQAAKIEVYPAVLRKYLRSLLAGDLDALLVESEQLESLVHAK